MEPQIQYAKTSDDVSIAYWILGEGEPALVYLGASPFTHVALEWQNEAMQRFYEGMAKERRIVHFDGRGCGLSSREVDDYTLDARILDLEAVVQALGLQHFALFGMNTSAPTAIAYVARYPERVSHLILMEPYARPSEMYDLPQVKALQGLLDNDWEMYTETVANLGFGWEAGEPARRFASFLRQCVSHEVFRAYLDDDRATDLSPTLQMINTPTLVVHRRAVPFPTVDMTRRTVSEIRDARLVLLEGSWWGEGAQEPLARHLRNFLGGGTELGTGPPSGMTAILFVDIADSTALTTKLGDAAYREQERALDASLRVAITDAGGTPVEGKVLGDGVMAVFTSARQAIDAAVRCRDLGNEAGLPLHLGIHAGDVVREGNSVHGGAVQVAARVQSAASPGQILVSATVRDLARTSAGVAFQDRGEHELEGIPEPQRLFAVRE